MFNLASVEVDGFWGKCSLKTALRPDVTIFIGPNGSGKTTLINLLQAAMTVDLPLLERLDFTEIRMDLVDGRRRRKIALTRLAGEPYLETVRFQIGTTVFKLPLIPRDVEYRRRVPSAAVERIREVRHIMSTLVSTSWLSVHREILEEEDYELRGRGRRIEEVLNPIDKRLVRLMERLTAYRLALQSEVGKLAAQFQRTVLTSMLYNPKFDTFSPAHIARLEVAGLRDRLSHAYSDLGALDDTTSTAIDAHIKRLTDAIESVKHPGEKGVAINDVLPLALLLRTTHIAELSSTLDKQKKDAFSLFDQYLRTLTAFMEDKTFTPFVEAGGGLTVAKDAAPIPLQLLSSGEKQLLILLTETLLQQRRPAVFIADEPELSLHVDWQRRLLGAIRDINDKAQVIVATHSPEIAGMWNESIVDMGSIVS